MMIRPRRLGMGMLRSLGTTTADLATVRRQWKALMQTATAGLDLMQPARSRGTTARGAPLAAAVEPAPAAGTGLVEVRKFGANPGALRMLASVPEGLPKKAPLVVVLHGCTQTSRDYDRGAGWTALAREAGFAVLYPEQQRQNNANVCFSWFQSTDTGRDRGEALSIREMIGHMLATHDLDERRVFITGLSAGGAMATAMLASYPEVFQAGALIGALPYGAATGVADAFQAMSSGRGHDARAWGDLVRAAAPAPPAFPAVSVWHGTADPTVRPVNAKELVLQWRDVHGLPARPDHSQRQGPLQRRTWTGADGRVLLEEVMVEGMTHGVPVDRPGGPHFLDVGISSTDLIARGWGLVPG